MAQPAASKVTVDLQQDRHYDIGSLFEAVSSNPVLLYQNRQDGRDDDEDYVVLIKDFKKIALYMFSDFKNANYGHAEIVENPRDCQLEIFIAIEPDALQFYGRYKFKGLNQKQESYLRSYVEKTLIPGIGNEDEPARPESPVFGEEKKEAGVKSSDEFIRKYCEVNGFGLIVASLK